MIEFQNVSFKYHYEQYALFENLSFTLNDGTNTVLCDVMSGKSTLCKMILGLVKPDSGKIVVDGKDIGSNKKFDAVDALLLPSKPAFFQNRTVGYNLQYPLKVRKQKIDVEKLHQLACKFGLLEFWNKKVGTLSPVLQKKLAIVRGLTVPRKIVLFDGFFDDTMDDCLSMEEVLCLFDCKMQVVFTTNPSQAVGSTVVLDGKTCVFQGEAEEAQNVVKNLQWLSEKLKEL